jgi:hypothetical protein
VQIYVIVFPFQTSYLKREFKPMPNIDDVPILYILIAAIVSIYQAYRGYMFQWIFARERNKPVNTGDTKNVNPSVEWTRRQKIVLLCISDMFFYLITTLSGFLTLFLAYFILKNVQDFSKISTGLSALLIFLTAYGVLGICAQLPNLMQLGKFPWKN